jgi:hypothetical protein
VALQPAKGIVDLRAVRSRVDGTQLARPDLGGANAGGLSEPVTAERASRRTAFDTQNAPMDGVG